MQAQGGGSAEDNGQGHAEGRHRVSEHHHDVCYYRLGDVEAGGHGKERNAGNRMFGHD